MPAAWARCTGKAAPAAAGARTATYPIARWHVVAAAIVGGALGAGLFAALAGGGAPSEGDAVAVHLALEPLAGLDYGNYSQLAISPDGTRVALAPGRTDGRPIHVWDLTSPAGYEMLPGTAGAYSPLFSDDGRWLAYVGAGNRVYRVPAQGGQPEAFTEAMHPQVGVGSWSSDGEILFAGNFAGPALRLHEDGGAAEVFLQMDAEQNEMGQGSVVVLPGGEHVVYAFWDDRWRLAMRSLESGERTVLFEGLAPRYAPTGHLVFIRNAVLMAATLDLDTLEVGEPVQLLDNMIAGEGWGRGAYAFSNTGTLVYLEAAEDLTRPVFRVDRTGDRQPLPMPPSEISEVAISPAGDRLALTINRGQAGRQIWAYDLARDDLLPIGQGAGWDQYPFFLDGGDRIGFTSERLGAGDVFVRPADGTGEDAPLVVDRHYKSNPSWSPGGQIAVWREGVGGEDIWVYSLEDPDNPVHFTVSPAEETLAVFSPDGSLIAYQSDRTGRNEIYVAPYPGGPAEWSWKATAGGGTMPRWAKGGREILYRADDRIMVAAVTRDVAVPHGRASPVRTADR